MKIKNNNKLVMFQIIFVTALVTSNVVAGKLVGTGLTLFGLDITFPSAVFAYAVTFLMTDVIGELWGKETASKTVTLGFIAQITSSILIVLAQILPALDSGVQTAYEIILGQNVMFVIGSFAGYWVSQKWDVWIFHKIRKKFVEKELDNKKRWIWNNISTTTSQIFDTAIFITIAFGIGMRWIFDPSMYPTLFGLMISQYFVKFLIALIDTPFFYLLTKDGLHIGDDYNV